MLSCYILEHYQDNPMNTELEITLNNLKLVYEKLPALAETYPSIIYKIETNVPTLGEGGVLTTKANAENEC